MASVVDSIRSVYQERFSLLKLGVFSYLIYFLITTLITNVSLNVVTLLIFFVILYLYLGFICIIINNRINQRIQTLPSFDIMTFTNVASKAFSIAIPYVGISYFGIKLLFGLFSFEGIPQQVAIWMTRYFILSAMISALIHYSQNININEGMNLPKVMSSITDVMAYTFICIVTLTIMTIFIIGPTLYLIYNFFKFGALFQYTAVFFATTILAMLADYWGQLHYDIESKNNYY